MTDRRPGRSRVLLLAALTAGAGIISAVAAAGASGPFASLRTPTSYLVSSHLSATPIDASALYPSPSAAPVVTKVIDMYDLPAAPVPPQAAPRPATGDHHPDTPRVHSTPAPSGGHDGGGGDD